MHVDRQSLTRAPQRDLIHLVRVLRVFVNSLRMYPQEHPVLLEQADRLIGHLCDAHRAHGDLLIDARSYLLAVNESTIDKAVPELKESVELSAWLRERGVQTVWVGGVLLADDLLDVFGWLSATEADACRQALESGRRPEVQGPLALNPALDAPAPGEEPTDRAAATAPPDPDRLFAVDAPPGFEEEDTLTGERRFHPDTGEAQLREAAGALLTGPFGSEGLLSSLLAGGDPVAALADALTRQLPGHELRHVYGAVEAVAVARLLALRAPDLVDLLGRSWPEESTAGRLRRGLVAALEGCPGLALEVVGKLGNTIYGGATGVGEGPAIEVLEAHVPWLLQAGQRREALRAVQILDRLVADEQRTWSLRQRADIGLRRVGRSAVLRALLQQLKETPGGDPETEEVLYLLGARSVPRLLEELRDAPEKAVRLDLVDLLTVVGRMARAHGDDADAVLAPLDAVLDSGTQAPWTLVRNVVLVLGNVGTPGMQARLQERLQEEQDPRVLSEIALGLMGSGSRETLQLLGSSLMGGRLASAEAFKSLLPALLEHDQKGTFKGLENLFTGGSLSPHATRASVTTLVAVLGERSEPFLRRVFTARPVFRRKLLFSEAVREAAIDALGEARGGWVDGLLQLAEQDPSARLRDRVADLRQQEAPTGIFKAIQDPPDG